MLFKISNEKVDRNLPENNLTFVKTHIPHMDSKVQVKEPALSSKWIPCLISSMILMIVLFLTLTVLFYMNAFVFTPTHVLETGICHYKHKTGICLAQDYCCDGEYVVGKAICSGTLFCCMGAIRKCKDHPKKNRSDFWSFQSLTHISSKIIFRNVSESEVEQAIVVSLSALEEMQYFHEMSEKIGTDMSDITQQKWFTVVGNKDSFDISVDQFSAFILIAVNDLEVLLFRLAPTQKSVPSIDMTFSNYEPYQHHTQNPSLSLEDHDYGLDSRPTFEIIRSELNHSMQEYAIQTIDYVINSCLNSYECISGKLVPALNQQFQNREGEWQTIITSNTGVDQLSVDVDYLHGFLLDGIFDNRHRILIYKTGIKAKETELDVIKSGRKALAMNKTIIYENSLTFKANDTKSTLIEDIRQSVVANNKFLSICRQLTSVSTKYLHSWGCVAGPQHTFSYNINSERNQYLVIKLNELLIILFRKSCNKGFRM